MDSIFDNSPRITPSLEGQGDLGAESSAPDTSAADSTPDTSGQVDGEQQGTVEAPAQTQPEWMTKFKSPDEMYAALQKTEKSYNELRPKFTKTAQELSAVRKTQTTPPAQETAQQQKQPAGAVEQILGYVNERLKPIQEQNEELVMQNNVMKLASEKSDFIELSADIKKVFEENPKLWNAENPLELAYYIAKGRTSTQQIAQVAEKARQEAYADKELKVISPVSGKSTPSAPAAEKTEAETIKEGILQFAKRRSIF